MGCTNRADLCKDKFDIELVPRVGNQRIILGNADSLANQNEQSFGLL
jgi:hypothetical protein